SLVGAVPIHGVSMPHLRRLNRVVLDHAAAIVVLVLCALGSMAGVALAWGDRIRQRLSANEVQSGAAVRQAGEARAINQEMQGLVRQIAADVAVLRDRSERE